MNFCIGKFTSKHIFHDLGYCNVTREFNGLPSLSASFSLHGGQKGVLELHNCHGCIYIFFPLNQS